MGFSLELVNICVCRYEADDLDVGDLGVLMMTTLMIVEVHD